MKLTRIKLSLSCFIPVICMLWYSNLVAEENKQYKQPISQTEEIDERLNLYKRIRLEENKKTLMQLLHDIADIQKQCRDKGYLCNAEGLSTFSLPTVNLQRPAMHEDDTVLEYPANRSVAPNINLLGIVGGRARFRLEDGRIQDFSLDEPIADIWKITEITADAAALIHNEQPEIRVLYQIHRGMQQEQNATKSIP